MTEIVENWEYIHPPQVLETDNQWKELILVMEESILEDPLFDGEQITPI